MPLLQAINICAYFQGKDLKVCDFISCIDGWLFGFIILKRESYIGKYSVK